MDGNLEEGWKLEEYLPHKTTTVTVWLWRKKQISRAKPQLIYLQEHIVAKCEAWDKRFAIAHYLTHLEIVWYKTNYNIKHMLMCSFVCKLLGTTRSDSEESSFGVCYLWFHLKTACLMNKSWSCIAKLFWAFIWWDYFNCMHIYMSLKEH